MNAMRSFEDRRAQVRITAAVLIVLSVLSTLIAMCLGAAQLPLATVLDALGAALRGEGAGTGHAIVVGVRLPRILSSYLVGMALSVVIMVIQVAGSGGSYPVHVLPQLFQTLYPFMPFHYGMDMIRETVGGMYGDTYLRCALVLLGMCALFTVFGLLVYYPARRLNAAIAASKEKSGIM